MTNTLSVTNRSEDTQSTEQLRAAGKLPAVVYGPKQPSTPITIDKRAFEVLFDEAGESTIISLTGLGEDIEVLVQDVAFDPERGGYRHVDFYAIERGKELTTNVGIEFIGEAPVEKTGATVNKVLHEVEVTCRPSALPSHLEVDLSGLDSEDAQIKVGDLVAPEGVTIDTDADAVIVSVSAARKEEADDTTAAVDMDAVAVEGKDTTETTA